MNTQKEPNKTEFYEATLINDSVKNPAAACQGVTSKQKV